MTHRSATPSSPPRQGVAFACHQLVCYVLLASGCCWLPSAQAEGTQDSAAVPMAPRSASVAWQHLTPSQQQILSPLSGLWPRMEATSQEKWLRLADRYPALSVEAQQRVITRMHQWADLPDNERSQARLRFQQARQMSPEERQQRWQAYQALPEQERQDLARMGVRKKNPILLDQSQVGPPEMAQVQRQHPRGEVGMVKQNVVPPTVAVSPAVVAPALVKGGPGATTTLVNQAASPPLHQHVGLPKVNASEDFVDSQTLLPLRGPQGAGMTPVNKR